MTISFACVPIELQNETAEREEFHHGFPPMTPLFDHILQLDRNWIDFSGSKMYVL